MVLSVLRLVYRLTLYGSRSAKTEKKKGKGGKKGGKNTAPVRDEPDG